LIRWKKKKAAGPDGVPLEFYQECLQIIEHDVMDMFSEFYEHKLDLCKINYGVITLIPNER
jgi:hypothetical protein